MTPSSASQRRAVGPVSSKRCLAGQSRTTGTSQCGTGSNGSGSSTGTGTSRGSPSASSASFPARTSE
ncbi:hypothetical protein ACFQQB_10735 [Nonomuraea rubra]|uniref:hypothetical protein n=1 Tax=Nonomuraea rubra TaxID=46180 RepID=UPI003611F8E4